MGRQRNANVASLKRSCYGARMARNRKPLGKPNQAKLVLERLRAEPRGPVRQRLRAIQLGLEGELGLNEIAEKIGSARSAVQEWFDRYRAGGLKALLGARRGKGPRSWLTPKYEEFLREGLNEGRWRTVVEVHRALVERGLEIQPPTVYNYLRKILALPRKPRPSRAKQTTRLRAASRRVKAAGARKPVKKPVKKPGGRKVTARPGRGASGKRSNRAPASR
jgi:transposase